MPWKLISLAQGRWRLVKSLLLAQKSVSELTRAYGISRKTAYKWKGRFLVGGRRALRDRSRRPRRSPQRTPAHWVRRIGDLRKRHRRWGAKKLRAYLQKAYAGERLPVVRTITRWLGRLGLSRSGRRRAPKGPRVRCGELTVARWANQVWTVDFKGWWRTADGRRVEPLTVRDLFSRYVLTVRVLPDQQWWRVRAVFMGLWRRQGRPEIIRVDNGGPFGSIGPAGLSRLSAWWVTQGIRVEFIRPGHPEENGAHEQMHRELKAETARPPSSTFRAQQRRIERWRRRYNQERPHEALGQRTPAQLYRRSRTRQEPVPAGRYPAGWESRRVRSNGQIRWQGRLRFMGEAFVGCAVGLRRQSTGNWQVYLGRILLGELRTSDACGLRPAAYVRKHRSKGDKKKKV